MLNPPRRLSREIATPSLLQIGRIGLLSLTLAACGGAPVVPTLMAQPTHVASHTAKERVFVGVTDEGLRQALVNSVPDMWQAADLSQANYVIRATVDSIELGNCLYELQSNGVALGGSNLPVVRETYHVTLLEWPAESQIAELSFTTEPPEACPEAVAVGATKIAGALDVAPITALIMDNLTDKLGLEGGFPGYFNLWAQVRALSFSPNGDQILIQTLDKPFATLWEVETGKFLRSYNIFQPVQFSTDGTKLIGPQSYWDVATGQETPFPALENEQVLGLSPNGQYIVTSHLNSDKTIRAASTGELIAKLNSDIDLLFTRFSPDSTKAINSAMDNAVRVWDITTGQELVKVEFDDDLNLGSPLFSSDGQKFAVFGQRAGKAFAYIYETQTGKQSLEIASDVAGDLAFSPDGKWIVTSHLSTADNDQRYISYVLDAQTGKPIKELTGGSPQSLTFSPDSQWIVGFEGVQVLFWDTSLINNDPAP